MAVREYVGARYVPIFADEPWTSTIAYEPLTVVLYQGNSYTSRQAVPVGIDIANETYWAETGNYNAQVEAYRKEVADEIINRVNGDNALQAQINEIKYLSFNVKDYGAVGNGTADDTQAFSNAIDAAISTIGDDNVWGGYTGICGFEIYIPAGHYKLSKALIIPAIAKLSVDSPSNDFSGVRVRGFSRSNTVLDWFGAEGGLSVFGRMFTLENVSIRNVNGDGALFNEYSAYSNVYNCAFYKCVGAAINMKPFNFNMHIENVLASSCGLAINHQGGTSTQCFNVYSQDCTNGYSIIDLAYSSFYNCSCDATIGIESYGYSFSNSNVVLDGCGFEGVQAPIIANNASKITALGINVQGAYRIANVIDENSVLKMYGGDFTNITTTNPAFIGAGQVITDYNPFGRYAISALNGETSVYAETKANTVKQMDAEGNISLCTIGNIRNRQRFGAGVLKILVTQDVETPIDGMFAYYEVYTANDQTRQINVVAAQPATSATLTKPTFDISIGYGGSLNMKCTSKINTTVNFNIEVWSDTLNFQWN